MSPTAINKFVNKKTKTKISQSLKEHYKKQKSIKRETKRAKLIIIALIVLSPIMNLVNAKEAQSLAREINHLPVNGENKSLNKVQVYIIEQAKKNNVNIKKALDIAWCESRFDEKAKNNQGSSAKGVYQFIDKTWSNYCQGDVMNYKDNIDCFMKLYKKHPNWWACNDLI